MGFSNLKGFLRSERGNVSIEWVLIAGFFFVAGASLVATTKTGTYASGEHLQTDLWDDHWNYETPPEDPGPDPGQPDTGSSYPLWKVADNWRFDMEQDGEPTGVTGSFYPTKSDNVDKTTNSIEMTSRTYSDFIEDKENNFEPYDKIIFDDPVSTATLQFHSLGYEIWVGKVTVVLEDGSVIENLGSRNSGGGEVITGDALELAKIDTNHPDDFGDLTEWGKGTWQTLSGYWWGSEDKYNRGSIAFNFDLYNVNGASADNKITEIWYHQSQSISYGKDLNDTYRVTLSAEK